MSTDELLELVRRYALEHCPRTSAVRLTLSPQNGDEAGPYLSALVSLTASNDNPAHPHLGPTERQILKAIVSHEADAPTGPEIAQAMNVAMEPGLRKRLSALRKLGYLGGRERDQGYPITPLGLSAIDV